ncbi:helix-turn-helix domain-containing protein [Paraburkholderia heleia]|uniref:helix-turn-helix domain-containing protein n=1 Tax=Paraburkholderia heleia TaxID=634127 RepID=UPI002AB64142|nr:helix-turn-helix domain-containing protein [Paraburkholderia heleia]
MIDAANQLATARSSRFPVPPSVYVTSADASAVKPERVHALQRVPLPGSRGVAGQIDPREFAGASNCRNCATRDLCMPTAMRSQNTVNPISVFGNHRKVRRGEAVYRAGDAFCNLYVIRAGSSKTVAMHRDGREQITGFQIAGDFLGMEGITSGKHTLDAIALEDSVVCVIPFATLEMLSFGNKDLQRHLHLMMSREIVRESAHMMLIGCMTAEERVASFLLGLSKRYRERGYSSMEFQLRMTREEIGCYLGLKLETVSRMFTRLQQRGAVRMKGKQARIVDIDSLERV